MRTKKLLKRLVATPMSRAQFLWSFVVMRALFCCWSSRSCSAFAYLVFRSRRRTDSAAARSLAARGPGVRGAGAPGRVAGAEHADGERLINLVMLPMFVTSELLFHGRFRTACSPVQDPPAHALNDALPR